jgi:hypothetical protein
VVLIIIEFHASHLAWKIVTPKKIVDFFLQLAAKIVRDIKQKNSGKKRHDIFNILSINSLKKTDVMPTNSKKQSQQGQSNNDTSRDTDRQGNNSKRGNIMDSNKRESGSNNNNSKGNNNQRNSGR